MSEAYSDRVVRATSAWAGAEPGVRWIDACLGPQREMLEAPERRKAAVCGRRAGKTSLLAMALYDAAEKHPHCVCPYVCLTKSSGRYLVWPVLKQFVEKHGIECTFQDSILVATLPNGSLITVWGADEQRDMEKLRGGRYARVVVDEAGSFPRTLLGYLIDEVLEPATVDLLGEIWLAGTPNAAATGFFYDVSTDPTKGWRTWHWTMLDNTYIPHAADELARIMREHGWNESSPVVRREWLGQWYRDESLLVYRYRTRHLGDAPACERRVLAVDLGASATHATTAFVEMGWRAGDRTSWVLRADKYAGMGPDEIAEEIRGRRVFDRIVCDPGGLGGGYIKLFRERYGLPVLEAQKKDKAGTIELLNGAFDGDRLRVDKRAKDLIEELELLTWNAKRTDGDGIDHCCDAMLYAWRETYSYAEVEKCSEKSRDPLDAAMRSPKTAPRPWWAPRDGGVLG